ncbi:FHA domain-containing protein [Lignipirellula cremea]|nr:FHA domain-containing protein [Lignipirellula cremea]
MTIPFHAAEQAFHVGQIDEAARLLGQPGLVRHEPARTLAKQVAGAILERARRRLAQHNPASAWRDLEAALRLAGPTPELQAIRQQLANHCTDQMEQQLAAGEYETALQQIPLWESQAPDPRWASLAERARSLVAADKLARRGCWAEAIEQLNHGVGLANSHASPAAWQEELQAVYASRMQSGQELAAQLQQEQQQENWEVVGRLAGQLLALAPEHPLASTAKRQAAAAIRSLVVPSAEGQRPSVGGEVSSDSLRFGSRFLLWIDGVGGYLVCRQKEVLIGQARPGSAADIGLLGDLTREHARIRRDGEEYLIEPLAELRQNGQPRQGVGPLIDGDELELGGVRLRFTRPHALSATARLEFVGRRRIQPTVDAILLMAESCVLGPNWHNHVVCRDWTDDVVLFQQGDRLQCRRAGPFTIAGRSCEGLGQLSPTAHVTAEDFSFSLESLPPCSPY